MRTFGKLKPLRIPRLQQMGAATPQAAKAPALAPGTLIHVGDRRTERMSIQILAYDPDTVTLVETGEVADCLPFQNTSAVKWLRVTGLHDVDKIAELGHAFGIHALLLEDILNTRGRSKIEMFDEHVFTVSKLASLNPDTGHLAIQHFAALVLPNTLITFQEEPTGIFDPVVARIQAGSGRIRNSGIDYLGWAIFDAVVDNYLTVIDAFADVIAQLDDQLQDDPLSVEATHLYATRHEVSALHRLVRPLREIANTFNRPNTILITEQAQPFFRDLHDHAIHALDQVEDLRDTTAGLREFYLSAVSNRMNEVMKVLTCFSTIFLPLTFLAGIYGMNFQHMPELGWKWAYPALWTAFLIIAGGMFILFRRKKWL